MSKLNKSLVPYAIVFVAVVIAVALFLFNSSQDAVLVEGVMVDAGNSPFEAFSGFSRQNSFVVSPQLYEPVVTLDQYMFNGAALAIQVLEGSNKDVEQLVRVYNHDNEMLYCMTNRGDVKTQETVGVEECQALLDREEKAFILIQFPNNLLQSPVLELKENRLTVKPKAYDDIGDTTFLALKIMYANALDIVDASNSVIDRIGS